MKTSIDDLFGRYEAGALTRREMVQALLLLFGAAPVSAQTAGPALTATRIDHVSILVSDLERSRSYYEELFGAKARAQNNLVQLALGPASHITLAQNQDRKGTIDHVALTVEGLTIDQALAAAKRAKPDSNFHVESDGVTYFTDPDGTRLQLVARPA